MSQFMSSPHDAHFSIFIGQRFHHSPKYGCCYALKCMVDGAVSTECDGVEVHSPPLQLIDIDTTNPVLMHVLVVPCNMLSLFLIPPISCDLSPHLPLI